MFCKDDQIAEYDNEIWQAVLEEEKRQQDHVELIASENYTSARVMQAQGTQLTNKYAEGYPGKRYYGGCEHVDVVEQLAIDRAKALFSADYANVQPHSGSQANAALGKANITVNKNSVPNDPQSPFVTSGLRIGTPAITTRGFGIQQVTDLTHWICDVLDDIHNEDMIATVRANVLALCEAHPVYR